MPDATHEAMTDEELAEYTLLSLNEDEEDFSDCAHKAIARLLDEVQRLRAGNRRLQDEIKRDNLEIKALVEELDKKEDEEC